MESQAHAYKSANEVRTELTIVYDLFMHYIVANAEAYPEKYYLGKLLKDLNTIRDSKRRLTTSDKKAKSEKGGSSRLVGKYQSISMK